MVKATDPKDWTGRRVKLDIGTTVSTVLITVVAFGLTATEGSLKNLLREFAESCVIVFRVGKEHSDDKGTTLTVELFPVGDTPEDLPIYFKAPDKSLLAVNYLREESAGNRGFHPLSNQDCPGALCRRTPESDFPKRELEINLRPFDAAFAFKFAVILKNKKIGRARDESDLSVFVIYPKPQDNKKSKYCRVEEASWYNVLAWVSPVWNAVILILMMIAFSIGIGLLKRRK